MSQTISITRALATLTKVEGKLEKRIAGFTPVHISAGIGAQKIIPGSLVSVEQFSENVARDNQGILDLLKLRDELKGKIVQSNATTEVTVGKQTMTVAQAIETKRSIKFSEDLLARLKAVYNKTQMTLNKNNSEFEARLEQARTQYVQRDKAPTAEQLAVVEKPVRDAHTPEIVDPINIAEQIRELEEAIEDFKSNVDFTLSESNAKTEITIDGEI